MGSCFSRIAERRKEGLLAAADERNDEGLPPFGSLHRDSSVFAFHQ